MTGKQLKKSIGKTRIENFDPVKHKNFEGVTCIPLGPDPTVDGLVIIPLPCKEICERTLSDEMPQGHCNCPPGKGGRGSVHVDLCHLTFSNGRWTCSGICITGKCRFRIVRFRLGKFQFFGFDCSCGI